MTERLFNLLTEPLITTTSHGRLTLPGVLAALARDEVESFPALRPHQGMFWHMFLVQLAALALHGADTTEIPEDEESWTRLLRRLTPDFLDDEPWCLVVEDWTKPAFMQAPVPGEVELKNPVPTPDALDLLITSKNHDLKQSVAHAAQAEDWLFALVSLQTGEGQGGRGNYGVSRMNGGFSSRPLLSLAPLSQTEAQNIAPRLGAWFRRDMRVLLETREKVLEETAIDYLPDGGVALTWLVPWAEEEQFQTRDLDIWFIEICRRVRLSLCEGKIRGVKGTSKATRINAKNFNGALDDPWAPVHKTENKSLTLSNGDFDYKKLTELLFSGDWKRPLLAELADSDPEGETLAVIAAALSRGNKTEGFKSRTLPLSGRVSRVLGARRAELHELAQAQVKTIVHFDNALADALVMAAGGERARIKRELYALANTARAHLDTYADTIFFEHLWARFDAQDAGGDAVKAEETTFAKVLWQRTEKIFEQALPAMPCASLFRPRAEARARAALRSKELRENYPELFQERTGKGG